MTDNLDLSAIREHYDTLSPLYDRFWGEHLHHGYWTDGESASAAQVRLIRELAAFAGLPRGARVLDVGCGVGGTSVWLARELGCEVLGITLSPVQVALATRRARAAGCGERVRFAEHDANRLALPPQSFDAVWVVECSEHLFDKPRFLQDCARVLRPGGVLALAAWIAHPGPPAHAQFVREVCHAMLCPSLGSMAGYEAWLRAAGFTGVRAREIAHHVAPTWIHAAALLRRPALRTILRVAPPRTRDFAAAFATMRDAYAAGALGYAFFSGRSNHEHAQPSPSPATA